MDSKKKLYWHKSSTHHYLLVQWMPETPPQAWFPWDNGNGGETRVANEIRTKRLWTAIAKEDVIIDANRADRKIGITIFPHYSRRGIAFFQHWFHLVVLHRPTLPANSLFLISPKEQTKNQAKQKQKANLSRRKHKINFLFHTKRLVVGNNVQPSRRGKAVCIR